MVTSGWTGNNCTRFHGWLNFTQDWYRKKSFRKKYLHIKFQIIALKINSLNLLENITGEEGDNSDGAEGEEKEYISSHFSP